MFNVYLREKALMDEKGEMLRIGSNATGVNLAPQITLESPCSDAEGPSWFLINQ